MRSTAHARLAERSFVVGRLVSRTFEVRVFLSFCLRNVVKPCSPLFYGLIMTRRLCSAFTFSSSLSLVVCEAGHFGPESEEWLFFFVGSGLWGNLSVVLLFLRLLPTP